MRNKSRKGGPAIVCHVGYGPTERNTENGTQNSMYGIAIVLRARILTQAQIHNRMHR